MGKLAASLAWTSHSMRLEWLWCVEIQRKLRRNITLSWSHLTLVQTI